MKPIKLKIKGLNSFMEEQTIDFEKLTQQGLFGIFGPTGSGKTTILDGITLALYGEVSRKSNTFINANCDSCHVSFEFMIHGKVTKKYRVTRKFKRDKMTGNSRSDSALLIDITVGEEILQDKITLVSKACEEVIGLGLEDFTRTVVLPQGKFSEFLKLEGKNRRDMLERLFNLQRFGDELTSNLSKKLNQVKMENSVLLGELKGYEEINDENIQKQEELLNKTNYAYKEVYEQQQVLLASMKIKEDILKQEAELLKHQSDERLLKQQENQIRECEKQIKQAEAAKNIMPTYYSYEQVQIALTKNQELMNQLNNRFIILQDSKEKLLIQGKEINVIREVEYPAHMTRLQQLEEAIKELKIIRGLDQELNNIQKRIQLNSELSHKQMDEIETITDKIKAIHQSLQVKEKKSEVLNVDEKERDLVQKGWMMSHELLKNKKLNQDLLNKQIRFEDEQAKFEKLEIMYENQVNELKIEVKQLTQTVENLKAQIPNHQELIQKNMVIQEAKETYTKRSSLISQIHQFKLELIKNQEIKGKLDQQLIEIDQQVDKQIKFLDQQRIENLASQLRFDLQENQPCPVCGSVHHELMHEPQMTTKSEDADLELMKLKDKKDLLMNQQNQIVAQLLASDALIHTKQEELAIQPILDFGSIEQQENELRIMNERKVWVEMQIQIHEDSLVMKQKELNDCLITQGQTQTNLQSLKIQLEDIKQELKLIEKECESMNHDFIQIQTLSKITDFDLRNNEIKQMDTQLKVILDELKQMRIYLATQQELLEMTQKAYHEKVNQLNLDKNTSVYKEELRDSKRKAIEDKFNHVDHLEEETVKVSAQIVTWNQLFKDYEIEFERIEKDYVTTHEALIIASTNVQQYSIRVQEEQLKLHEMIQREGFVSINELIACVLSEEVLNQLKTDVERYHESLTRIQGFIERLLIELKNQHVSMDEWEEDCLSKDQNEGLLSKLNEDKIKQEQTLNIIKAKMIEMGHLLKKKVNVEHQIALLNDLEKLFKGKKFVEYAALSQLRYVSYGADQRLKAITNGNYGIEIDENGRFIIRDYKNGGVARETATLSGGETFLASLSLALSLSAQIQLKGSAPLELFFLDEGFGTLDEHYLDIVMDSLEKIHNEHLKIGLITHVESIKNRMPIKLMIEPAVAGEGGSKVHIERL